MDNTTPNKKSLFLKIGIIVAIVGVIVGIFIFKSVKDNEDTAPETSTSESQTDGSTAIPLEDNN